VRLGDEGSAFRWLAALETQRTEPVGPAPYYILRFEDAVASRLGYWVPSAGVAIWLGTSGATWFRPAADGAAALATAASLLPYTPRVQWATVGARRARSPSTYLRLYTMGTQTDARVNRRSWIPVWIFAAQPSPWTDGSVELAISSRGGYLRRDGQVLRIDNRVAARIRAGLPLR
jgi:hypothetical protein